MNTLLVGVGKDEITPPIGTHMAGYQNRQLPAEGAHDPLYVRALAISDGKQSYLIVVMDTLVVTGHFVENMRNLMMTNAQIKEPNHLWIAATHTHAGPGGLVDFSKYPHLSAAMDFFGPYNSILERKLQTSVQKAAQQAIDSMKPSYVLYGAGTIQGIGANRRIPDGPVDIDLPVLTFEDVNGHPIAMLFSQGIHPTVLGPDNRMFSGDFIGLTCHKKEEAIPVVLGFSGAAGDTSTRATRRAQTFDEAERLADKLVETIRTIPMRKTEKVSLKMASRRFQYSWMTPKSLSLLETEIESVQKEIARLQAKQASHWEIRQAETKLEGLQFQRKMSANPPKNKRVHIELAVLQIGEVKLFAFPGELFARLGIQLRENVGRKNTIVIGYANDFWGYLPSLQDYEQGGYEVDMALLNVNSGETMIRDAINLTRRL